MRLAPQSVLLPHIWAQLKLLRAELSKLKSNPKQILMRGSTQNGIKSNSNGPPVYNTSFTILDAKGRTLPIKKAAKQAKQDTGF